MNTPRRIPPSEPFETEFPLVLFGQGEYAVGYDCSPRHGEIAARPPVGTYHSRGGRVFLWVLAVAFAWLVAGVCV